MHYVPSQFEGNPAKQQAVRCSLLPPPHVEIDQAETMILKGHRNLASDSCLCGKVNQLLEPEQEPQNRKVKQ